MLHNAFHAAADRGSDTMLSFSSSMILWVMMIVLAVLTAAIAAGKRR